MDYKRRLENISKKFDLNFDFELKFLELGTREIIIRRFICGCPDPVYERFREKYGGDLNQSLGDYLNSKEYLKEVKTSRACVVIGKYLKFEKNLADNLCDLDLRKEVQKIYSKIEKEMGSRKRLTLVWKNDYEKYRNQKPEIILHEFVHELLEENGIRPKNWKWNEGLVTYITYAEINALEIVEAKNNKNSSEYWNIYCEYTRNWIDILEKIESPKERKKIILDKIKSIE